MAEPTIETPSHAVGFYDARPTGAPAMVFVRGCSGRCLRSLAGGGTPQYKDRGSLGYGRRRYSLKRSARNLSRCSLISFFPTTRLPRRVALEPSRRSRNWPCRQAMDDNSWDRVSVTLATCAGRAYAPWGAGISEIFPGIVAIQDTFTGQTLKLSGDDLDEAALQGARLGGGNHLFATPSFANRSYRT